MLAEDDRQRFYGRVWTYHAPLEGLVGFDATPTREHKGPLQFLEGFTGYLQGDAYSGNLTLRKKTRVFMVGCMAHLRRYFVAALEKDPRAAHFIAVIKGLYEIEAEASASCCPRPGRLPGRPKQPPLRLRRRPEHLSTATTPGPQANRLSASDPCQISRDTQRRPTYAYSRAKGPEANASRQGKNQPPPC